MNLKDSPYCDCLFFSLSAFYREFTRLAEEEFAETGFSASHAFVLMSVTSNPGIGPGEIARHMLLSPSTVTRLIDKLESRNLVEKKTNGKYMQIEPTTRGKERDVRIRKAWDNLFKRYVRELGGEFSARLTRDIHTAFDKIKQNKQ